MANPIDDRLMAKGDFLREFESIVMLSLLRMGDDAYGMTVRQDIEERTKRPTAVGAVYAALERKARVARSRPDSRRSSDSASSRQISERHQAPEEHRALATLLLHAG